MSSVKKSLLRLLLWNKRLFRKPCFVLILVLIPLSMIAILTLGSGDHGAVTVAVAAEDPSDPIAADILSSLRSDDSRILRFIMCDTPSEATDMVRSAKSDSAWILPRDLAAKTERFASKRNVTASFVSVIEREETLLQQVSREKLYSLLYPYVSRDLYVNFIRRSVTEADDVARDELLIQYDLIDADGSEMFSFRTPSGEQISNDAGYITSPLRGLLSVLTVLSGLAVSLFFIQDKSIGLFSWIPENRLGLFSVGYTATAVADTSIAVLAAIIISGFSVSLPRELLCTVLFAASVVGFCAAVREIFTSIKLIGAMIPVLVAAMIAVCPIFFSSGDLARLGMLFPPYYYLGSIYDPMYLLWMAVYSAATLLLAFAVRKFKEFLMK